jgi:hypothetical protein
MAAPTTFGDTERLLVDPSEITTTVAKWIAPGKTAKAYRVQRDRLLPIFEAIPNDTLMALLPSSWPGRAKLRRKPSYGGFRAAQNAPGATIPGPVEGYTRKRPAGVRSSARPRVNSSWR